MPPLLRVEKQSACGADSQGAGRHGVGVVQRERAVAGDRRAARVGVAGRERQGAAAQGGQSAGAGQQAGERDCIVARIDEPAAAGQRHGLAGGEPGVCREGPAAEVESAAAGDAGHEEGPSA